MARKLKTYQTSLGFFDLAIAAPSMKAALEAWGAGSNLFHQGVARETDDPDVVAATSGFDPRAHSVLLAGGTRAKGPPLRGVVITAHRAGALLTGLATALAVGSRRSGVAITAPTSGAILQASASLRPSIRRYALEGRLV